MFVVVAEDTAALLGIVAAFVGVVLAVTFDAPWLDGIASMVIGTILIAVATLLVYETRSLIMGESADPDLTRSIRAIAMDEPCVSGVPRLRTMQVGPHHVMLNMDLHFHPEISTDELFGALDGVEGRIRDAHPQVKDVFLEIEALRGRSSSS